MGKTRPSKIELIRRFSRHPVQRFFLNMRQCENTITAIFEIIGDLLMEGHDIYIDRVGHLYVQDIGPKRFHNYKTGNIEEKPHLLVLRLKPTIQMKRFLRCKSNALAEQESEKENEVS